MWGSPLSGTPWSSTEKSSSAGCQTLGDGVWLGLQNFYATWLGRHHPSAGVIMAWDPTAGCQQNLGFSSCFTCSLFLVGVNKLQPWNGQEAESQAVGFVGQWFPVLVRTSASVLIYHRSTRSGQTDFYHLAVAGSCGALRVLSRPDRRE